MRTHDYLIDGGLDFSYLDERLTTLLSRSAPWLDGDDARRARLGLHELLVNIRRHAYNGAIGPISVGMTASPGGVTVMVTDWGSGLPEVQRRVLPTVSDHGGYGLGIIDRVFSEVEYRRASGRNEWVLAVHAADVTTR
ncbi:ATP-binding protein [Microcella sp.]|uniref:ATP-binding protein n=1 Tax=Microcella sp. TaxID=1913979 RepID=UPI00299F7698|nr:ATP-binding protein [Microcella sp.]MDX2026135.1 ATP-binding protein [Microcella sp.]